MSSFQGKFTGEFQDDGTLCRTWSRWRRVIVRNTFDCTKLVCRKFENRDLATTKILLVGEALVGSDEQIELAFSEREQFAIPYAFPTHLLRGMTFMIGEQLRSGDGTHSSSNIFTQAEAARLSIALTPGAPSRG